MRMTSMSPNMGANNNYAALHAAQRPMRLMDLALDGAAYAGDWPAYNVETLGDDRYRIVIETPGFDLGELEIVTEPNRLTVTGQPATQEGEGQVVYRGIVREPFKRSYQLADHVRVATARLERGLLSIDLVRDIPEALRPRRIEIGAGQTASAH